MEYGCPRILLADDDPEDLELIEEAIFSIAPTVELHKFTNGLTAMKYLESRPDNELPGLIILDYNMPELNGSQVLAFIRSQDRYSPIPKVVLSTSNAPLHINECMTQGATEYIVKPHSMAGLHKLAKKLLGFCKPR